MVQFMQQLMNQNLGILFTKCRKCGGKVVSMRDAIKCTECAWIDERKLSQTLAKVIS